MGKMSRDKGARVEREIVNTHIAAGIHAERYDARRGQFGATSSYDIDVYWKGKEEIPLCGEIKARKELPKWQRDAPMYVVPHHVWIRLLKNG